MSSYSLSNSGEGHGVDAGVSLSLSLSLRRSLESMEGRDEEGRGGERELREMWVRVGEREGLGVACILHPVLNSTREMVG